MQYLSTTYTSISKTIGIENATGTNGITVAYNTDYIQDGLAILFTTKPGYIRSVEPMEGTIAASSSQQIDIVVNSTDLEPDNYMDSIAIYSNDSLNPIVYLPISLHVNGTPQIALSQDSLTFGNVFVTDKDSIPIWVTNPGTDSLIISNIYFEDNQFELADGLNSLELYKNDSLPLWVYFSPQQDQVYRDSLVFINNSTDSLIIIPVTGTGLYPPVFASSPDSIGYELQVGDSVETLVIIDNTAGLSDLVYQVNVQSINNQTKTSNVPIGFYADETRKSVNELPLEVGEKNQSFNGNIVHEYSNIPSGNTGVAIVGQYAYISDYLNSRIVKYNLNTETIEDAFSLSNNPFGIIYDGTYLWIGTGSGNIYCYTLDGATIGSFSSPISTFNAMTFNGTHIVVAEYFINNPIFYELDYSGNILSAVNSLLSSVNQIAYAPNYPDAKYAICNYSLCKIKMDGSAIVATDSILFDFSTSSAAFSLYADNQYIWISNWDGPLYQLAINNGDWLNLESMDGTISAGATDTIPVHIKTSDLIAGYYDKQIFITSNDPGHSGTPIPVHLTMHGTPHLEVWPDSLVYDSTFVGLTYEKELAIYNSGTDTLKISGITSDNELFVVEDTVTDLLPYTSINVNVIFQPDASGTSHGILAIASNDSLEPQKQVSLIGYAQIPPIASLSVDSVYATLYSGESTSANFTLTNTGGVPMVYTLDHEYFKIQDTAAMANVGDIEYLPNSFGYLTGIALDPNANIIYGAVPNSYSFYAYNMENYTWDSMPDVPFYCNRTHAVYLNQKIYLISTGNSQMGIFDIQTNTWQTKSSPSSYNSSLVSDGKYLYFWEYNYIIKYNPVDQTSVALAGFPYYNSSNAQMVYAEGQIFVYFPYSSYMLGKYDLNTNSWTRLPDMPYYSDYGAAVDTYSGKLYMSYSNNLRVYDFESQTWDLKYLSGVNGLNGGMVYCSNFGKHGIYFTSGFYGTTFMRYETEVPFNWLGYESVVDTLQPDQSTAINLSMDASHLNGGIYEANLKIKTNSLVQPETILPVSILVNDAANISLSSDTLIFDEAYVGFTYEDSIEIINEGSIDLLISSIQVQNLVFTVNANSLTLVPNEKAYLKVLIQIPDTGLFESDIVLKSNAFPEGDRIIFVSAKGQNPPVLHLKSSMLYTYAMPEQSVEEKFQISNTGESKLILQIENNSGKTVDSVSTVYYTISGETTQHIFSNLRSTRDSIHLTVTLNGDYTSASSEYAELVIEGNNQGRICETSFADGTDFVRIYSFDSQTANVWLADGRLEVYVVNSGGVNPGIGQALNQVELEMKGIEWFTIAENEYTLLNGESLDLDATFNAAGLEVGDYETSFRIISNDPAQSMVDIQVLFMIRDQVAPIVKNTLSDEMHYITENTVFIPIQDVFFDINGDPLSYSVTSGNIQSVFASVKGDTALQLTLLSLGASEIKLSASDGYFDPVSTTFNVLVLDNALPLVVNTLPDTTISVSSSTLSIDLSDVFTDEDGDVLVYNSEINSDIAEVSVDGEILYITPNVLGATEVYIYATDEKSEPVKTSFTLTINTGVGFTEPLANNIFEVYPNPFKKEFSVHLRLDNPANVKLQVYNLQGEIIKSMDYDNCVDELNLKLDDWDNLKSGLYYLQLWFDEKPIGQKKLIKY